MPSTIYNMEQHEAEVGRHYTNLHRAKTDALVQETFGGIMEEINTLLRDNVYVFQESFIG